MDKWLNYSQILEFLDKGAYRADVKKIFAASTGLPRVSHFHSLLANPEKKLKVIHVAGTSGKGSTCYLLSQILTGQGFHVGMTVSPHILNIRERIQLNNRPISEKDFENYFNQIYPAIRKVNQSEYGHLTYFEILTGLAYFIFAAKKVDYAVIEVGLGGLLDSTNIAKEKNKLCVINEIGLDHTEVLGNDIVKIAQEKAGIIHEENTVVKLFQTEEINRVFEEEAKEAGSQLIWIKEGKTYKGIELSEEQTKFEYNFDLQKSLNKSSSWRSCDLSLLGTHQALNCALALKSCEYLAKKDGFSLNLNGLQKSLQNLNLPARLEIRKFGSQKAILDGAHNPSKIKSLLESVSRIFPRQEFNLVLSIKQNKHYYDILQGILDYRFLFAEIYLTTFNQKQDQVSNSVDPQKLKDFLLQNGFENIVIQEDLETAIKQALQGSNYLLATGSLYLISEIYKLQLSADGFRNH